MRIKKPYRARQQASIELNGQPEAVFALMCPVREHDWVPGWQTNLILSESGFCETDCIFTTPTDGPEAVWLVAAHDHRRKALTMYKVVPELSVTRLDIQVEQNGEGSSATIAYELTALSEAGRAIIDGHTKDLYVERMADWKRLIDAHLMDPQPA